MAEEVDKEKEEEEEEKGEISSCVPSKLGTSIR